MQKEIIEILGVKIYNKTLFEAVDFCVKKIKQKEKIFVTTPNPEILLKARDEENYKNILNKGDLNTPDGIGVLWAATFNKKTENRNKIFILYIWIISLLSILFHKKYICKEIKERVTGVDLMESICAKAMKNKLKIFLLGGATGIAERTKLKLETKYPGIQITGTYAGNPFTNDDRNIVNHINESEAEILFVAFGAPKQEKWIHKNYNNLKNIKMAVGIGGAFNFLVEVKKRSPEWMKKTGIEWLYRFIQEPARYKRILNATIKFPIIMLRERLKKR